MKQNRTGSYLAVIGSMLIFGSIGIFRRFIPLSSAMLAFIRGMLGSLCLALYTLLTGRLSKQKTDPKTLVLLVVVGAAIGFNWIFLFEAYRYTTVATATLCYYMEPTFVILLSPIFLKEKLTVKKLVCVAVSVVGMLFVSGVADGGKIGNNDFKGVLLGLGAAVFYAAIVILNKKITLDDAYKRTTVQLFSAAVAMIPYLILTEQSEMAVLNFSSIAMIVILGILHTGVAYALYFYGMNGLPAQSVAVLSYIDPVSALILSALILHEHMTVLGTIGAVLIIGAALISEMKMPKKADT